MEKNILKMTAAVIKHDVNHLLIKNNGNATARQKPLKIFRTDGDDDDVDDDEGGRRK